MKEKAIASGVTLFASMLCYYYAKQAAKDTVPYVMVGGFIGAIVGEMLAEGTKKNDTNK
jgi:uncharacterized BrkB/YihY/UPF0761 family membrane protein